MVAQPCRTDGSISPRLFIKAQENAKEAIINFTNKYFAKRMDMLSKLQMDDSIKNYLLNDNDYYELDTLIKPRLFTAIPCEVAEIHVITVF